MLLRHDPNMVKKSKGLRVHGAYAGDEHGEEVQGVQLGSRGNVLRAVDGSSAAGRADARRHEEPG